MEAISRELQASLSRPMKVFLIKLYFVYLFIFLTSISISTVFRISKVYLVTCRSEGLDFIFPMRPKFHPSNIGTKNYRLFCRRKLKVIKRFIIFGFTPKNLPTLTMFPEGQTMSDFRVRYIDSKLSNQLRPRLEGSSNEVFYKKMFAPKVGPLITKFRI